MKFAPPHRANLHRSRGVPCGQRHVLSRLSFPSSWQDAGTFRTWRRRHRVRPRAAPSSTPTPGNTSWCFGAGVADPATLAQSLVSAHGGSLRHTYASALKGFAASLPEAAVAGLRLDPLVAYVEPDHMVQVEGTEQMDANGDPWGLDRIDQRALPLSATYSYTSTGAGVHVYIIDTGSWTLPPEFGA